MSLKAEIELWVSALQAYEAQDFEEALSIFKGIADSSKIWFNIALINATLGEHDRAIWAYKEAMSLDEYFAVAAFQSGVSNFLLGHYRDAYNDFEASFQHMRANFTIDYAQIGLKFRLYSCEILFNRGLSRIFLGQTEAGLADLKLASDQKQTAEHIVIDEAFEAEGQGYTVFSIPVGVLFRPSETKVRNLKARDYLGKARLVAAIEERDAFTGFTGAARQAQEKEREEARSKRDQEQTQANRSVPPGMERSNTMPVLPTYKAEQIVPPPLRRRPTDVTVAIGQSRASSSPSESSSSATSPQMGRSKTNSRSRKDSSASSKPSGSSSAPATPAVPPSHSRHSDSGASSYSSPRSSSLPYKAPPPSAVAASPSRRPSGPYAPLPAIPQEHDEVQELFDAYSKLESVMWEGEGAKEASERGSASPAAVRSWVEKTAKSDASRTSSRRKKASATPPSMTSTSTRSPWRQRRVVEDKGYESEAYGTHSKCLERIRIKLHYAGDVRGLPIDADLSFDELVERIESKFGRQRLKLRFKDEEGSLISLIDAGDWECAVDVAKETSQGRSESKLELYVD